MKPTFSVVIPTYNRPHLLQDAVWSVLRQDFDAYEIIVVDNSEEDQASPTIANQSKRIRYIRTGKLSMADNWNVGFEAAVGNYVCVLSDRLIWSSSKILQSLNEQISVGDPEVITWKFRQPIYARHEARSQEASLIDSEQLLDSMKQVEWRYYCDTAPRGLNSAIRKSVLEKVKSKLGVFCSPFCPDFTLSFATLLFANQVTHFDSVFVYEQGMQLSNGANTKKSFSEASKRFDALGQNASGSYQVVPFKWPTVLNSVVNDFILTMAKFDLRVSVLDLDLESYFCQLATEIENWQQSDQKTRALEDLRKLSTEFGINPWKTKRISWVDWIKSARQLFARREHQMENIGIRDFVRENEASVCPEFP